eukprot:m.9232 g.9232  ORF g.9232 m.9232 type:complete len:296 (+) comp2951_c0_seq1:190-1077(+)
MDDALIQDYIRDGFVVVPDVMTPEEVAAARQALHERLEGDVHKNERLKSSAGSMFYGRWKLLDVHLHPNVVRAQEQLLASTYGQQIDGFSHPFGNFGHALAYVDRVAFRAAGDSENGLQLHLDCNPTNQYLEGFGGLKKWRPIQSFVTLTDHFGGNTGGLRVVAGFHHRFRDYFADHPLVEGGGEFFRMHGKSHAALAKQLQAVQAPAGALVLWDNRLPHDTCDRRDGPDSREAVFTGYLPDVALNRRYAAAQWDALCRNAAPPALTNLRARAFDLDWNPQTDLTPEQQRILRID